MEYYKEEMGKLISENSKLKNDIKRLKEEILDRIQNVLYQGVDTESQDLDLLRHDLENDIIEEKYETK